MRGRLCLALFAAFLAFPVNDAAGVGAARLVCYVDSAANTSFSECTHIVYAGKARGEKLDEVLKEYRKNSPGAKTLLRVTESDKSPGVPGQPVASGRAIDAISADVRRGTTGSSPATELVA
ncbi:hypothetical protein EVAR_4902_1 [Eumeta japonica]|uniref:Uncharacterized protein n=1 Tax=Eumeta variegata TaxID=151549 RepID=A0A4C1XYR2_EUMVA|nr:hypothetical protein EVAR_4902_1 [Eumeta japonica]